MLHCLLYLTPGPHILYVYRQIPWPTTTLHFSTLVYNNNISCYISCTAYNIIITYYIDLHVNTIYPPMFWTSRRRLSALFFSSSTHFLNYAPVRMQMTRTAGRKGKNNPYVIIMTMLSFLTNFRLLLDQYNIVITILYYTILCTYTGWSRIMCYKSNGITFKTYVSLLFYNKRLSSTCIMYNTITAIVPIVVILNILWMRTRQQIKIIIYEFCLLLAASFNRYRVIIILNSN